MRLEASLTKNIMNDVVVSCSLPKLIDSSFTMGIMKTRSKLDRFHYVSIFGSKQKLRLYLVRMLDLFLPCQDFLILSFSFPFFCNLPIKKNSWMWSSQLYSFSFSYPCKILV